MDRGKFDSLLKAFDANDSATIIDAFTEDATWEILGHWTMKGKEEIRKFFRESDIEVVESSWGRVIFSGTNAVVESKGKCRNGEGKEWENWCCDIYEFDGNSVKALRSFPIDKK